MAIRSKMPTPRSARMSEADYTRKITPLLTTWARRLFRDRIFPILERNRWRDDGIAVDADEQDDLRRELESALEEASVTHQALTLGEAQTVAATALGQVERRNRRDIDGQLSAAATRAQRRRIGAARARRLLGVDPLGREPWLLEKTQAAVARSLEHIQWATNETYRRATKEVAESLGRGLRVEELAKRLEENLKESMEMSPRRANFIARNELGNFSAELTEARHTDLGIESYRWRTSKDERVRGPGGRYPKAYPSHRAREGKVYRYDDPPNQAKNDGHPGKPYGCRCTAEPVFEDLEPRLERRRRREARVANRRAAPSAAGAAIPRTAP